MTALQAALGADAGTAEFTMLALILAVSIQYPLALVVYLDARRLRLKDPETYALGIIVPAAGFVVILYYLSERDSFPRRDDDASE